MFAQVIWYYLICINVAAFSIYGQDKQRARMHRRRISERTLMILAVLGGSVGALLAMQIFHHKTKKPKFSIGIPCILIVQAVALAAGFSMLQ